MGTKIEWTDETWNPVVGCTKVSEGCQNCYAERMAYRLACMGQKKYRAVISTDGGVWNYKTYCDESALETPLHWRKPRQIFVCSMGDLFHESVPFEFINKVMNTINKCDGKYQNEGKCNHIFQILTKRPKRMKEFFDRYYGHYYKEGITCDEKDRIWLGVTPTKDEDISTLLQTPAAHRFVSLEPLLEDVDIEWWLRVNKIGRNRHPRYTQKLDWVIVGAETGHHARYCPIEWIESVVEQCKAAGVPVFVKAVHLWEMNGKLYRSPQEANLQCGEGKPKLKISKNMSEWPQSVRYRELPYG